MKVWLISVLLVLLQCGLYLFADCPKQRFAKRRSKKGQNAGRKQYRLGLSKDDATNSTIVLTIADTADKTQGQINVDAPDLQFVEKVGEVFEFTLSARGIKKLERFKAKNTTRKFQFIKIFVNHDASFKGVRVSEVQIGDFQCTFPVKKPACRQLNATSCDSFKKAKKKRGKNAPKDREVGRLTLKPVAALEKWDLVVAFDTELLSFRLNQPAELVSSECGRIFNFRRTDQVKKKPGMALKLTYIMRFKEGETPPPIAYIFYGNTECNTSCGVKPVCPVTTAAPEVTTTEEPPEPVTTEEPPEPITTEEPPEPVTTEEPPEPVTTEEPLEPVTTEEPDLGLPADEAEADVFDDYWEDLY